MHLGCGRRRRLAADNREDSDRSDEELPEGTPDGLLRCITLSVHSKLPLRPHYVIPYFETLPVPWDKN